MQHGTRDIGPIRVLLASQESARDTVLKAIDNANNDIFAFCNMHTLNTALQNSEFANAISGCTLFNDGVGLDLASLALHGQKFPHNVNGTDLTPAILAGLQRPTRVYFLGSPPGVAERACQQLAQRFPMIIPVGSHHGYFKDQESDTIIRDIRSVKTELLLVGMGHPRQETWAVANKDELDAVVLCVGAFLDFSAGRVRRAPNIIRRLRAEWAYRLVLEPKRLSSRYVVGGGALLFWVIRERRRHTRKET